MSDLIQTKNLKKKKVLHLIFYMDIGGAQNLVLSLLKNLDRTKFDSVVCTIGSRGDLAEVVSDLGYTLYSLNLPNLKWPNYFRAIKDISALVEKEGIDVIHSNMFHANLIARVVAIFKKVKVVASIHNTYKKVHWNRCLINRFLSKYTSSIVVGSKDVFNDVLEFDRVNPDLVHIIPNSVDIGMSKSNLTKIEARKKICISESQFLIGTVGRLENQKGHEYLLKALSELIISGHNDVRLIIVGYGSLESHLKQFSSDLDLENHVQFLGARNDLGDLYKAMDVYVMPSLWEGLSLAMVSAMAAGLPIISTRVGGAQELLSDNRGVLVEPGDSGALATEIFRIKESLPIYLGIANLNIEYINNNYSDKKMTLAYEKLFDM